MKRAFLGVLLASVLWWEACKVPAWVSQAEQDAEVAVPIAASLVDVVDPALAPLVTLIENGFNALVKTLDTYKSLPTATNLQAVQAAFAAVNANVAQLESAAQIKNATTQSTVTGVVALLTQAVTEIAALVPQNSGLGVRGSGQGKDNSGFRIPNSGAQSANGEAQSVKAGAQSANGEAPSAKAAAPVVKHWKAADFKREFNKIVKGDPRFKPLK
jgi:hypothetical protein